MTRRVRVGLVVAVAVVIAMVVVWLAVGRGGCVQAERPTTPPARSSVVPPKASGAPSPKASKTTLTADEAAKLASDLVSADTASYRSAWCDTTAMPPKAPAGTKLAIDTGTFTSQQDAGKVNATITLPGKAPEVWRLLLLRKDGRWAVYTMEEVK